MPHLCLIMLCYTSYLYSNQMELNWIELNWIISLFFFSYILAFYFQFTSWILLFLFLIVKYLLLFSYLFIHSLSQFIFLFESIVWFLMDSGVCLRLHLFIFLSYNHFYLFLRQSVRSVLRETGLGKSDRTSTRLNSSHRR